MFGPDQTSKSPGGSGRSEVKGVDEPESFLIWAEFRKYMEIQVRQTVKSEQSDIGE